MFSSEYAKAELRVAPHKFLFNPAKRNFVPTMMHADNEISMLNLALADASRVVYKWNLKERSFTWSDNITRVMPFAGRSGFESESALFASVHEDDRDKFLSLCEQLHKSPGSFEWEYRLTPKDGKTYIVKQIGSVSNNGSAAEYIIGMIDAKPQAAAPTIPQQLAKPVAAKAITSSAYGYPEHFILELDAAIRDASDQNSQGALLVVSINNLAMIISAYGYDVSENVIRQLMERIHSDLSEGDSVERIHRDELAIILRECPKDSVQLMANKIYTIIQNYGASASNGSLHVLCSIGSVEFPGSATSALDAMDKAYITTSSGVSGVHRSFEETKEEAAHCRQQLGLANYLGKAIHTNRLRLAYQPIIESKTGKIAYYESLLRLIGDDGKISSAGALIPIAERMGLIDVIDHLVLDMVAKELIASPELTLSFNVSNMTTDNSDWLNHFTNILKDNPEIAQRIVVEITETAAQRDLRRTAYFVASIQELGCQVALDDFGSGYTSFRQLKALSVDMIKIDGAFIKDLVDNNDNRFFVKTLLDFTNGFGLKAVAEFVENGETAKMLMDLGVEYMQGYYFGRPENYRSWLNSGEYQKE